MQKHRKQRRKLGSGIEALEARTLFAADISFNSSTGVLTITGDELANKAVVRFEGDEVDVVLSTQRADGSWRRIEDQDEPISRVRSIVFNALGGNDIFEVSQGFLRSGVTLANLALTYHAGAGDDTLNNVSAARSTAFGGLGVDTFHGGSARDIFDGGDQGDFLFGNGGADVLKGGAGLDKLVGGRGGDQIFGGGDNDTIWGDLEGNTVVGENDELWGDGGTDTIHGGGGNDLIRGDNNFLIFSGVKDYLYGDDGVDKIDGDGGNDVIRGGAGNDTLYGGAGSDSIFGESGEDFLNGGRVHRDAAGNEIDGPKNVLDGVRDFLFGGADADTYEYDLGQRPGPVWRFWDLWDEYNIDQPSEPLTGGDRVVDWL